MVECSERTKGRRLAKGAVLAGACGLAMVVSSTAPALAPLLIGASTAPPRGDAGSAIANIDFSMNIGGERCLDLPIWGLVPRFVICIPLKG